MSYPSFEEYTDALRLPPGAVFQDPALASGTVRKGAAGVPFARSGNFALTYEVRSNGSRYAVRCFHKESDSLERRYEAIARKLRAAASAYFVDFDFQPAGIRTESGQYPVVKMAWAEGSTLAQFISAHRDDPQALMQLRETLRNLARHLQDNDIGHGDIQPGNIIVRSPTELKLIDYDGMYVPELEPWGSTELGQRNFQHPGRSWLHYDERLDRFSFALLDVALEALALQPALWELTGSDEAGIVLRASDFADPAASTAFGVLVELEGLGVRARQLAAVCRSPFERIPSLDDFLAGRRIPAAAVLAGAPANGAKPAYVPAYAVLDATNFARCCSHIGDRVELIGRVRRVVREPAVEGGGPATLRVEFGDAREDMVRLLVWPEFEGNGLAVLAGMPAGQWLSAIGLVDPILTESNGDQSYKSVSITITEQAQLRLLTETEALHRMVAEPKPSRAGDDISVTIGTDPALPGSVVRPPPQPARIAPPTVPIEAAASDEQTATVVLEPAPVPPPVSTRPPAMPEEAPSAPTAVAPEDSAAPAAAGIAARPVVEPSASSAPAPRAAAPPISAKAVVPPRQVRRPRTPRESKVRPAARRWSAISASLARQFREQSSKLRRMYANVPVADTLADLRKYMRKILAGAPISKDWAQRARRVHPAWWLVGVLLALLVVQSWIYTRPPDAATPVATTSTPKRTLPSAASSPATDAKRNEKVVLPRPAPPAVAESRAAREPASTSAPTSTRTRLLAFEDLRSARRPIATIAGPIDIAVNAGPPRSSVVTVNGKPLEASRAEVTVLSHRSVYSDREVIVGFSDCAGTRAACARKEPFWLLLRRSAPPVLKRSPGLRANPDAGSVNAAASGVHVDLGLWDGVRQVATLTSLDDIYVTRIKEAPAALSRVDCRAVGAALESCAASRDCSSFEAIAKSIPAGRMAPITRLLHESTGLNAPMFRTVCTRSCELGLTPTTVLVRREVCSGAVPDQWTSAFLKD